VEQFQEELLQWKLSSNQDEMNEDKEELAKHIFELIDDDKSGEVSLEEFRLALLKFNEPPYNAGLSETEVLAIVRDFDSDGDGMISEEEFLKVVVEGNDL